MLIRRDKPTRVAVKSDQQLMRQLDGVGPSICSSLYFFLFSNIVEVSHFVGNDNICLGASSLEIYNWIQGWSLI